MIVLDPALQWPGWGQNFAAALNSRFHDSSLPNCPKSACGHPPTVCTVQHIPQDDSPTCHRARVIDSRLLGRRGSTRKLALKCVVLCRLTGHAIHGAVVGGYSCAQRRLYILLEKAKQSFAKKRLCGISRSPPPTTSFHDFGQDPRGVTSDLSAQK